jgi:hypothetical protein
VTLFGRASLSCCGICAIPATSLSYGAVAFYFDHYEKLLLRYRKLATSYFSPLHLKF